MTQKGFHAQTTAHESPFPKRRAKKSCASHWNNCPRWSIIERV
ncbi:hypothetical protein SELSPUOL_02650 [Selenomonas sputigena ATCC 35185]|uniref:Uncharacterized protein n=1 Tax=Selenomonas sputigena (strain ATCC 35185 / DSM 20758 / CCUG 44933 / VPI D19B-28) TaxID=546271 RepID=C9LYT9_SELS3|nr:hypothetical protein SELSPUOL_02650 [Selenomonas sputigena ATCC 35185]